ncbi:ExeM/NucH family extracellular endonuclease [Schaalia dentiphila]|uniref:LPXTG-motif cell wall anchor domain protein n=1 Tax=Schaalia dentiphila ATCC 17982 TaxID=411466 RepID=A7B9H3_9ACTO|nr:MULTISPECIES: ExeM/NucH family extracellular endonuclease [Schaalia]EDN79847.1 LPXTG-motif cell wall anchor domain protein [Schaalia odontolytica ATCC 17982]
MRYGTRTLAVFGALALSAAGLVPASWAVDAHRSDSAQSGQVTQSGWPGVSQADAAQPQSAAAQPVQPTQPAETSLPEGSAQSGETGPGLVDTPIPDIQAVGEGDDSAMAGATVTTLGVVTAAYPASESGLGATLDGYTIQTPGSGGAWEPGRTRSDGLFVYAGKKGEIPAPGTCVRVTGMVGEFPATSAKGNPQSLTQLAATVVNTVEGCAAPTPTPLTQVPSPSEAEAYESMLLAPQGTWTITDNYQTNQYGTLTLTPGESPLRSATDVVAPGQAARDYEAANAARAIALDDGTNTNLLKGAATEVAYAYLANGAPARVGYHVAFDAPVVLETRHGTTVFQPTAMVAAHPDRSPVTITGNRPGVPTVGGDTRVATFNVLNYFSDLGVDESGCSGYPDRTGAFVTAKKCKVRGAFSREAFANQEAKIVAAINALGADVVALEEIENPVAVGVGTDRDASLARLVEALNKDAGAGTWAYVPSPQAVPEAEDVIRVAFIYKPATVAPVGPSLIHDDPAFTGLARQPLAQEFARVAGERSAPASFVVVANHFKSKGSVPEGAPAGNVDSGDGQGNANAIRVAQAGALASFAARFADKPTLLVGDFNSYSQEDPIKALEAAGWERVSGAGEASYVYAGRSGSLDHVFANAAAKPLLAGVTSWAINAQESIAFEYSRAGMNAHLAVEADNPYRSSDHNPEIIGLTLLGGHTPAPMPSAEPSAAPTTSPSASPSPSAEPSADPSASPAPAPSRAAPASSRKTHTRAATVGGLPRTGSDTDRAIGLGIILAAAGGGLMVLSRRTRRRG